MKFTGRSRQPPVGMSLVLVALAGGSNVWIELATLGIRTDAMASKNVILNGRYRFVCLFVINIDNLLITRRACSDLHCFRHAGFSLKRSIPIDHNLSLQ